MPCSLYHANLHARLCFTDINVQRVLRYMSYNAIFMCGHVVVLNLYIVGSFVALSSSAIYGFYNIVLKIDEEEYNGHGALLQEGIFTSVMLFLVSCIDMDVTI